MDNVKLELTQVQSQVNTAGFVRHSINCPDCRNTLQQAVESSLENINCPFCGTNFNVADTGGETRNAVGLKQIAQFKLVDQLGAGAFGKVYKALDTKLDRAVAIKIPHKGFTPEEERAFLREAQNAAQLCHPGLVPVFEVGRDEDTVFIVSELVRGVTLADWLGSYRPSHRESVIIVIELCKALQHAHDKRVIHRDLKPSNIMLDSAANKPRIMDFGLALRESSEITMTINGQVLGTPAYMPPEQARGDAHTADARSDIYALGVILFQMLTGELPFRGNARMLLHQVIHDDPPSLRSLDHSVPKDLETITLKCLAKEPDKRYPSAKELAEDLQSWHDDEPIKARPTSIVEKAWRWTGQNAIPLASLYTVAQGLLFATELPGLFVKSVDSSVDSIVLSTPVWESVTTGLFLLLSFVIAYLTWKGKRWIVNLGCAWYATPLLLVCIVILLNAYFPEISEGDPDFLATCVTTATGMLIGVGLFIRVCLRQEVEHRQQISKFAKFPGAWRLAGSFVIGVPTLSVICCGPIFLILMLQERVPRVIDEDPRADEVFEGAVAGTTVGVIASAIFVSPGTIDEVIRYQLSDDAGGRFAIDPISGEVCVADSSKLDSETSPQHLIEIKAERGPLTATSKVKIRVREVVPTPPKDIDPSPNRVQVDAENGTYTGITLFSEHANGKEIEFWTLDLNFFVDENNKLRTSGWGLDSSRTVRVLVYAHDGKFIRSSCSVFTVEFGEFEAHQDIRDESD